MLRLERARPRLGPLAASCCTSRRSARQTTWLLRALAAPRTGARAFQASAAKALSSSLTNRLPGADDAGTPGFLRRDPGLYVSVVLTPSLARAEPDRATLLLTLMAGVALAEGIGRRRDSTSISSGRTICRSRRPKLGGILAEASGAGGADTVIVGYGINVAETAFPPELRDRARRSSPSWDARRSSSGIRRDAGVARAAVRRPARGALRCYSRRVARARARCERWTRDVDDCSGDMTGVTCGIDAAARCSSERRPRRAHRLGRGPLAVMVDEFCREIETYLCRKNDGHLIRVVGPSFSSCRRGRRKGCRSRWRARGSIATSNVITARVCGAGR